jgi:hypothetical protein
MTSQTLTTTPNLAFKVSWLALLAMSVLAVVGHTALAFILTDETTLFIGWAAYAAYAALVILIPYRRGERWAWYATWLLVAGFASLIFFDAQVGVYYVVGAGVMAVCQFATFGTFFNQG